MTRTILVVDDDPSLTALVAELLEEAGYHVDAVTTGAAALARLQARQPALVLLDIELPDRNGVVLCLDIRQRWSVPISMLSASPWTVDRVRSLQLGADDFIAKPFDAGDLVARVDAVLRRTARAEGQPAQPPGASAQSRAVTSQAGTRKALSTRYTATDPLVRYGDVEMHRTAHTVTLSGVSVRLTSSEYLILLALVSAAGRTLTRAEITAVLQEGGRRGAGRAIEIHLTRLRTKLRTLGPRAPQILTIRGMGYPLDLPAPRQP